MGFPTKVQLIKRKSSEQWYVGFPAQVAQVLDFSKGEVVEWFIDDRASLILKRKNPPKSPFKKKLPSGSCTPSSPSSRNVRRHSNKSGPDKELKA
jgi:hypothetical protein